ncbi:hypothetical protein [Arthrobacter sp. Bz4]|uniref:hypothetical protein n=1 Tax=Arthrobacter sp. Bz4 TaxID=2171979 RepID=UPI0010570F76|nr:hypothetical protein [Arthrobacter sp. Bz4]
MDFSMNSSVVLAAIVGLWLIWVAPYVLRIRRPALLVEPVATSALVSSATAESKVSQGSIMEMSGHTTDAAGTMGGGAAPKAYSPQGRLTIRRGRGSIAAIAAVALLAAVVCIPLAVLSLIPALVPAGAFVLFLLAVAGLRVLAVRDRRRKVEAAFADAMSHRTTDLPPRAQAFAAPAVPAPRRETNLFDAETTGPAAESSPNEQGSTTGTTGTANLTAIELRQAALAVAASATVTEAASVDPHSSVSPDAEATTESAGTPWEPVEVPKPMYVAAAKAQRQAPAPLELPAVPKAQAKTTLKQGAAAPAVASPDTSSGSNSTANPTTGRMNLDDVLQRRRA